MRNKRRGPRLYDTFILVEEMEEFLNWLVDQGCDVHQGKGLDWDHHIKFTTRRGHEGIVQWGHQGNMLAHDMINKWREQR